MQMLKGLFSGVNPTLENSEIFDCGQGLFGGFFFRWGDLVVQKTINDL